jgi:hypothetical protein
MTDKQTSTNENIENSLNGQLSASLYRLEHISDHHLKERRHHFRITNIFVWVISSCILVIAGLNIYHLYSFYKESIVIIDTVDNLDMTVVNIAKNMKNISSSMSSINNDMAHLDDIYGDIASMSNRMYLMRNSLASVGNDIGVLNGTIYIMNQNVDGIDFYLRHMSDNMGYMGYNVQQISRPMGMFNRFLP